MPPLAAAATAVGSAVGGVASAAAGAVGGLASAAGGLAAGAGELITGTLTAGGEFISSAASAAKGLSPLATTGSTVAGGITTVQQAKAAREAGEKQLELREKQVTAQIENQRKTRQTAEKLEQKRIESQETLSLASLLGRTKQKARPPTVVVADSGPSWIDRVNQGIDNAITGLFSYG